MTERTIDQLLADAERTGSLQLGGLIDRLAAEHRVRGARRDGRAIGPAGLADITVSGVTNDSRAVRAGSLFVAVPGLHVDGHDFVEAAAQAGAAAVLVERPVPDVPVAQLVVGDVRSALASAAAWWYEDPSDALAVVGITGTDGKTTTSFLAVAALEAAGIATGMTGTAATRIGGVQTANEAHATTPEAPDLQRAMKAMRVAGDAAAVIETTSHGLALGRVDAIAYDIAILTNLTHEHLELHGTWEAYRDAKLRLFEKLHRGAGVGRAGAKPLGWPATGIVNADDPSAGAFVGVAQEAGARVLTYGTDPAADVRATRIEEDQRRLRIAVRRPVRRRPSRSSSWSAGSTPTTRWLSWPSVRRSASIRPPSARAWPRSRSCPGGWSGSTPGSRSGSSSTSRTARLRSRLSSISSLRWPPRAEVG